MPLGEKEKQSSSSGRTGIGLLTGRLSVQRPDKGTQTPLPPARVCVCSLLVNQGFTIITQCVCNLLYVILIHGPAQQPEKINNTLYSTGQCVLTKTKDYYVLQ